MLKINNTVVQAVCYYWMIFLRPRQPASCSPQLQHSAVFHLALCVWLSRGAGSWRVGCVREVSSRRGRFGKWEGARRHAGVSDIGVPMAWYCDGSGKHWQEEGWKDCFISCWCRYGLQSGLGCRYIYRHCKPYCTATIALIFQVIIAHVNGGKGGTLPFPWNMGIYCCFGVLHLF